MSSTLPTPKDVRDLLQDLLDRKVEIQVIDAWGPAPTDQVCIAEFVDDHRRLQALAMLDLPLTVFTGASIGLVPPAGARDMITEQSPSKAVLGNLYEVLNVLSSTFNVPDSPHVRIAEMHEPGTVFPTAVAQVASRVVGRLDLTVDIQNYGNGRLSLIAN